MGDHAHANPVWLCEWSQPYLKIMRDIVVTDETQFTQGGITNKEFALLGTRKLLQVA